MPSRHSEAVHSASGGGFRATSVSISATPLPLLGQLGVVPDEQEEEDQDDHLQYGEGDHVAVAGIHSEEKK